jgi:hypothetical protein
MGKICKAKQLFGLIYQQPHSCSNGVTQQQTTQDLDMSDT